MITSFYIPLSSLLTNSPKIRCYVSKVLIRRMGGVESQFHTFLNVSLYGGKLCCRGNRTLYPLNGTLGGPQSRFEHFGIEKKTPTSAVIEPSSLLCPSLSLGAVPTALFLFMALHRSILALNNIKGSLTTTKIYQS